MLAAYSTRDLQHAAQIMTACRQRGLALEACLGLVLDAGGQQTMELSKRERCPACGRGQLLVLPVNDGPGTVVDGPYRQVLLCRICHHEEWS